MSSRVSATRTRVATVTLPTTSWRFCEAANLAAFSRTSKRAGSLDQATEQKGRAGQGTLISSNPRDNYRIIGTYPVPSERFAIIFPYSVERDRSAWRWSWGAYAEIVGPGPPTTGEARKMTGKAAELAALLTRLPLDTDFFRKIEDDLVDDGLLSDESRRWICSVLRELPLLARQEELREKVTTHRDWYVEQLIEVEHIDRKAARRKADATLAALFAGWRDPVLRRATAAGTIVEETGVPLRAMVAYLFGEVAKCFFLIHHPDQWIEYVTRSQRGDRCVDIVPDRLPSRQEMEGPLAWEHGAAGAELMDRWLEYGGAAPFDYNQELDDASLALDSPPEFRRLEGSNFFRGLALIDLAEAMLHRAFGAGAVGVRVNAAGQGDYFQVHIDTQKAPPSEVKRLLGAAFYRRFGALDIGVAVPRGSALRSVIPQGEQTACELRTAPDVRTFAALEAVASEWSERGGWLHLWMWGKGDSGDFSNLPGGYSGPQSRRINRYIAARLGPVPSWSMGIGWDPTDETVIIEAHGESDRDDVPDIGDDSDSAPDTPRVRMSPLDAWPFAIRATRVVAAGRPPCPFCHLPIDPDGHICPRANGYRRHAT